MSVGAAWYLGAAQALCAEIIWRVQLSSVQIGCAHFLFLLLLDLLQGSAILFRPMQNFIPLSFIGSSRRFASLEERTKVKNL